MKAKITFLVFTLVAGCVSLPYAKRIAMLRESDLVGDVVRVRVDGTNIEMRLSDVDEALQSEAPAARLRLSKFARDRVGSDAGLLPDGVDEDTFERLVGRLLDAGKAAVVDRRSGKRVSHILAGYRDRGYHGPYYCLPDGYQFLSIVTLIE